MNPAMLVTPSHRSLLLQFFASNPIGVARVTGTTGDGLAVCSADALAIQGDCQWRTFGPAEPAGHFVVTGFGCCHNVRSNGCRSRELSTVGFADCLVELNTLQRDT